MAVSLCQVPAGSGRKALDTQATGFQILVLLICDDKIEQRKEAYIVSNALLRKVLHMAARAESFWLLLKSVTDLRNQRFKNHNLYRDGAGLAQLSRPTAKPFSDLT